MSSAAAKPHSPEEKARSAAAEPFAPLDDSPPVPALIQEMWWGWVKGWPVQLPHERLYLFLRLEDAGPAAAERAIGALIARHHTLRTGFVETDERLAAFLHAAREFPVETVRIEDGSEAAYEAERLRFTGDELRIESGWLTRARVVAGPKGVLICLLFHHMVFDARSRLLVERELRERLAPGTDPARDLGPVDQYIDYAAWERLWLSRTGADLAGYWHEWLAAMPATGNPAGGVLSWRPGHKVYYDFEVAGPAVEGLRALAGDATPFRLLLAATGKAVAAWTGQPRFALRVVGDLRTTRPMPDMIGNLVCTDLVEVDLTGAPALPALLEALGASYRTATQARCPNLLGLPGSPAFPDVGPHSIGTKTAVTLNYMPLYKLRGQQPPPVGAPGASAPAVPTRSAQREYWPTPVCPINLRIWDWGDRLVCRMEFDDDVIAEPDQRRLIDLLTAAVANLPADADA